jgi:protein-tyrosine-phosphatase/predicted ATP-grasp superfamily ATP-dependent carboligase
VTTANVLLLGDEPRIVINVARSLRRMGARVTVGKLLAEGPALPSRAVARYVRFPIQASDPGLAAEQLVGFVRDHRCNVVVPCSDMALRLVRAAHADLSALALLCCPDPDAIGRVLDKSLTLALAARCGIAGPKEYAIDSVDALAGRSSDIRFPVVAKPRSKEEESHFKTLTVPDLSHLLELVSADPEFGRRNLIQEFVPGHGVGVAMLFDGTRMLVGFQHRRLREYPVEGGVSVQAISEPVDAALGAVAIRLLQEVRWQGIAMVEFRWDPVQKRAVLMEINGRYWGSLPLAMRAGVDFPRYELEWRPGAPPRAPVPYRSGTTMVWVRGMLLRIKQVAGHAVPPSTPAPSVLADLLVLAGVVTHPGRDALWSAADPLPSVMEALATAAGAITELLASAVRLVLPPAVAALIRAVRRVRPGARRTYLILRLRHWLGRPVRIEAQRWRGARSVVFVCHGNIMRSAFAAARLRQLLAGSGPQLEVVSAGVWAQAGKAAEPAARQVATALGVTLDDHRATPLTAETVRRADIILVMDFYNLADVLARYPQARGKTQLLAALGQREDEIVDPYGRDVGAVSTAFSQVDQALSALLERLRQPAG